ncbi:uncharacterized protein V6R79_011741 [Siganus canaliculatus]
MKLLKEIEDTTHERKFVKSQVEKRRRERMNRSLERLRNMLLQEPQHLDGNQRRVEKAEILERTVLFLQNISKGDEGDTQTAPAAAAVGGQKYSFQDGISTCLQRAAQFLGPDGKGLWLGATLDASFAARISSPDSDSAGTERRTKAHSSSSSLSHTKSILRVLRQKSQHRLHSQSLSGKSFAHQDRQGFPTISQQAQGQSQIEIRAESGAGKQSSSQSHPSSQTLWRPWP